MNRRKPISKHHLSFFQAQKNEASTDFDWKQLTPSQLDKCAQKFQIYKCSGSQKLSKYQLCRMLKEIGKEVTQYQAFKMLEQADPKGHGQIGYEAFIDIIQNQKTKRFNNEVNFLGLTYESMLAQQKKYPKYGDTDKQLNWDFFKYYIYSNFELEINMSTLTGKKVPNRPISRNQFMNLFS